MKTNWGTLSGRTTMTLSELDHMENIGDDIRKAGFCVATTTPTPNAHAC